MDYDKLILDISKGDMDALETLYNNMYSDVFALSMSLVKNPMTAADLTQDTFISVFQNARKFKSHGKGRSWILKIASNISLNFIKKFKQIEFTDISEHPELVRNPYSHSEDIIFINALFKDCSKSEREIMVLKSRGYTHKEISAIVGIPEGTVRWKYSSICKRLKNCDYGGTL